MPARVQVVSADAVSDPATHEIYYKPERKVDAKQAEKLRPGARFVAGMPVEAYNRRLDPRSGNIIARDRLNPGVLKELVDLTDLGCALVFAERHEQALPSP